MIKYPLGIQNCVQQNKKVHCRLNNSILLILQLIEIKKEIPTKEKKKPLIIVISYFSFLCIINHNNQIIQQNYSLCKLFIVNYCTKVIIYQCYVIPIAINDNLVLICKQIRE